MNRWKIKIVLVVVFILVIYLLLKIRKKETDRNSLTLSTIKPKLEHFFVTPQPGPQSQDDLLIKFRNKYFQGWKDSEKLLEYNKESEKKIAFSNTKILGTDNRFLIGPNAICFDTKNDDLVVLDIYRLRRFQCRDDRKASSTEKLYPQLKFNLNDNIDDFKIGSKKLTLKNTEILDSGLYYKNLLIAYLEKIQVFTSVNLPSEENEDIINSYENNLKKLNNINPEDFPIEILEENIETFTGEPQNQVKRILKNETQLKNRLKEIFRKFKNLHVKLEKCTDVNKPKCLIKYQYDIPPFALKKNKKGIHDLSFDSDPTTIYHPQSADQIIRPFNNDWNKFSKKGIFQPQILDDDVDKIPEDDGTVDLSKYNKINKNSGEIIEGFANPKQGYVSLKNTFDNNDEIIASFNLTRELDNIGVNMFYDKVNNCMFVPDVMNNRIQIMECLPQDFYFKGQFGNLPYTSHRSLPNYVNNQKKNIHFAGGLMYEPIVDTERYDKIKGYNCAAVSQDNDINIEEFKKRGPFNIAGKENNPQNVECNLTFNQDRFNIHSRNMLESFQQSKEYVGHFGKLFTEYNRLNGIDINTGNINDISDNLYFHNPHFIGVVSNIGGAAKDGVTEASLAYKKLLYKNIKITHEGQKFGQLFRPKAIAFDNDYKDKNGQKYYVVDTYHHCIQCFENLGEISTLDGRELNLVSADIDLNEQTRHYYYDEKMNEGSRFAAYSNSPMYSLGIRQKIIDSTDYQNPNSLLTHHPEWALANGQHLNKKPRVMLFRWLSGTSEHGNSAYNTLPVDYNSIETKFFYSSLGNETRSLNPGCGEFLFPSDILITKNPYTKEKLMMVADTGNNRVSIFKKYQIPNINNEFRFRFFRFLYDTNIDTDNLMYNPISMACCENTGRIFVLNGNLGKQKILVFTPEYDIKKKILSYKLLKGIQLDDDESTEDNQKRCIRITLDDRGLLGCLILDYQGDSIVKFRNVNNIKKFPFDLIKSEVRLNSIFFSLTLNQEILGKKVNEGLPNLNRFRLILNRLNHSVASGNDKYKKNSLVISPEYKLDYIFDAKTQKIDKNRIIKDYTMKDELRPSNKSNYWCLRMGDLEEKIKVDLVNDSVNPPQIQIAKFTKNLEVSKFYRYQTIEGNKNLVLNNVEDWIAQGMYPNTSYKYNLGMYNYDDINFFVEEGGIKKVFEEITMPLGVPSKMISRRFDDDKKSISLSFQYANLSQLHYETQKFNPLYCYVFRKEHNRDRNVSNKFISVKAKQWIQIIVPADSKYMYSKFSKPKFGKLYIFNAYAKNSPEEQNNQMEINKYYREDYQIIYYSAEGGNFKDGGQELPDPELLGENPFLDDFFTLGDDPSNIHRQIKFRVRIDLQEIQEGIDDKYLHFSDTEKIGEVLEKYNKDRKINEHSMILVKKEPLFNEDLSYKSELIIEDKGNKLVPILHNKTYEYFVMIGNQKKINAGVNSFYVTTKPSQPLFNKKGLEKITLTEKGQKKNYLKIEWFTPKNEDIYWPFNFLVCRRVYKEGTYESIKKAETKPQKNPGFKMEQNQIRMLEPKDGTNYKYYHQVFKHDKGDWKVSFMVYGKYQGDLFNSNGNTIKKGVEYNFFSQNLNLRIKYFDHKENKIKEDIWNDWSPSKNFRELPNVSGIELFIPLGKGFTLTKMAVDETVVIEQNSGISKLDIARKLRRQKEIQESENEKIRIENEKIKAKNRVLQKKKQLGQVFLLTDDYDEVERSNYSGYGGELYRYLKDKPKNELLKIFDTLHRDLLIFHGDVTMKLEGPSGMLRSGNRDMLIDKIRYMSMLLRKGHNDALDSVGLICDSSSVSQMFSGGGEDVVNPQKKCLSKQEKQVKEKKKIIAQKKEEIKQKKELSNLQKAVLEEQAKNLRAEMESAAEAEKEAIRKEIKNLEKQMKEEEEALKQNADLIKQEKELAALEAENMEVEEELDKELPMPAGIEKITEKGTYLEQFRDVLKIERVIKNKMYIGNYGGFYGEKMRIDLKTFLTDLRTGITTNSMIRENFKTMSNIIYDFNKRELFFVLPGEKVKENLGNLVDAPNHIVIFFGEERKTPAQLQEEKESTSKMSDEKLKKIQAEIEEKKKLLIKEGVKDIDNDPDLIRLQELSRKIQENKTVGISEWSFLKQGKPELFTAVYPDENEIAKVLEDYAITPTLASLSSRIGLGSQFFSDDEITPEQAKKEYISHHQLIELSEVDLTPYQYCIGTFQTGFSFNSEDKKSFMGMEYITDILDDEELNDKTKNQMPVLNHGGSYSQIIEMGKPIKNEPPAKPIEIAPEVFSPAPESNVPVIKFFSPKEGLQGSVVKIVGQKLDEIEYYCFRDVKAEILQKTKTFLMEGEGDNKQKVVYDMVLLKVPTLKQLGKECWQSLRPYEALVWGYYKMGAKQIRTSEVDDITQIDKGKEIQRKMMFRYLDRTQCPEGEKLDIPK